MATDIEGGGGPPDQNWRAKARRGWRRFLLRVNYSRRRLVQRVRHPRLRWLRRPDDPLPILAGPQIRVGRILGRALRRIELVRERWRIERSQASDRLAAPRILGILLRAQRALLGLLFLVVLLGLAADVLLHEFGRDILGFLPATDFFRDNLSLPSEGNLRVVLGATAAATGTILGIVLSISLIVFQSTAERYESPRIIGYLLRERVGLAVVRLLAIGFIYSLLLLGLVEVFEGFTPYVASFLAVAFSAGGVVSLITYRGHALAGYLPESISDGLAVEIRREIHRAQREGAARSVEDYARRRVADDVATAAELIRRLVADGDAEGQASTVRALTGVVDAYLPVKAHFAEKSLWYRRRPVRIRAEAVRSVTEHITGQGLMAPTDQEPDHDWLESELLALIRPVRNALDPADDAAWESLSAFYAHLIQLSWITQEFGVLAATLVELTPLVSDGRVLRSASRTQQVGELAWIVVDTAAGRPWPTAQSIVDSEPWRNPRAERDLPYLAGKEAGSLRKKIQLEIAIGEGVQTPRDRMIRELDESWSEREAEHRAQFVSRGATLARQLLRNSVGGAQPDGAATAAEMVLRTILRGVEHQSFPPLDRGLLTELGQAYGAARDAEAREGLDETLSVAIRRLAEEERWADAWLLVATAATAFLPLDRQRITDAHEFFLRVMDLLFLIAYVYGWAELRQQSGAYTTASMFIQAITSGEALFGLIEDGHLASTLLVPFNHSVKYGTWFQPLMSAIRELPERYVGERGSIGVDVRRDHPSPLFANWHDLGSGHDAILEHLIQSLQDQRSAELERLARVLAAMKAAKS